MFPIISETNESDLYGFSHERQQLTLKLAWTITIHKSQGLTLDKAKFDIAKSEQFTSLIYVDCLGLGSLKTGLLNPWLKTGCKV